MKKLILSIALIVTTAVTATVSQASDSTHRQGPSTNHCYIDGSVKGMGLSFVFGGQIIAGEGVITCTDSNQQLVEQVPVRIQFMSAGLGFDFSVIREIQVHSAALRLSNGAADLVGSFSVGATAGATLLDQGIDFDTAIQIRREPGLSLALALKGKSAVGLGVRLQAMTMLVTPIL